MLENDDDLVYLIKHSKVSYMKGLRDAWDSQSWTKSFNKKESEKEITLVVHYHET
jgi:phage repressor protein C with HTH and peptisase S24 domain